MGPTLRIIPLLIVVCTWIGNKVSDGHQGGPSSFGYDASSACSKPSFRLGRARYDRLPCDFRNENWCTIAGNAYPWHAVRRFVQENQGLMRRMYGDEKHISVLKNDFGRNDVELELDEDEHQLYSHDSSYPESLYRPVGHYSQRHQYHSGSGRSLSDADPIPDGASDHTASSSTPKSTSSGTTTTTTTSKTFDFESADTTIDASSTSFTSGSSPSSSSSSSIPTTIPETTTTSNSESVSSLTLHHSQNTSINEIPAGQPLYPEPLRVVGLSEQRTSTSENPPESDLDDLLESVSQLRDADIRDEQQQQQFRPRPEYKPSETSSSIRPSSTTISTTTTSTTTTTTTTTTTKPMMEGQLFQDVAAKDKHDPLQQQQQPQQQQAPPVLKVRGINACPVKEEVVAPFWANNTRGEVLALLNLYPFEQYVHWEKCTNENKQMYCRDGCRCEQQYRLHRLLAYDPSNECRGIFSDWFKFPSCCICRCYELPLEFRVTSRSPRQMKRRLLQGAKCASRARIYDTNRAIRMHNSY
ncbi:hypothetical protein QAD02_000576 [Eretmocerus hayati]|uniref:Uncharacterized protein n=1 Tax=Eretmocerus hayati TaxID=131215 RepID=A0ACC2NDT1_9HYME|nr:hypothetical protein QAD02_000576 [Eretmocerus hayati]